ncbi:MAG: NADH/ubiquinone/plastoquinone (complex I), partial [Elusimicrobiota bacterium]
FWSKFIIIFACIQAGKFWLGFIAVVVSLLTLSSFLKVQKYAFFGELKEQWKELKEVPWLMCLSMIILSLMCIGFGLLLVPAIRSFVFDPAVSVLLNGIKI